MHASASPFEALAERLNWCDATIETDAYGKGLLAAGAFVIFIVFFMISYD
jgi:hypothetical protein